MEFTAKIIAQFLNGIVEGDENVVVRNVSKIEEGKPGTLSFLANPKYLPYIYTTESSIVLVNKDFVAEKTVSTTLIRVPDAYQAFASLLELYQQTKLNQTGIEQPSFIHEKAQVGTDIYIGAFAYIGEGAKIGNNVKIYPQVYIGPNAEIGDNSVLFAGVKVYHECKIGKNCIIHAGSVIGSDGFGFAPQSQSDFKKIPQIGNVVVEDNVEIGANTTIDRATMGSTILRKGVKLDNLIQIAHNVEIGEHTVIAALTGISGSSKIGKDCMLGGQIGIAGHISIADNTKIGAQAGIESSVKTEGNILIGSPAFNLKDYMRSYVFFKKLPDISKKIDELEKKIQQLISPNQKL